MTPFAGLRAAHDRAAEANKLIAPKEGVIETAARPFRLPPVTCVAGPAQNLKHADPGCKLLLPRGFSALKACGYKFVTLDLGGFKSGGLHAATK